MEIIKAANEKPRAWEENFFGRDVKPTSKVILLKLFKDDLVLCDSECNMFSLDSSNQLSSLNPDSTFELFSDRMQRLYPDYNLDR